MNFDLNTCPLSERNGTYGGKAGSKEGILIDGEYWIVKYPQNTQGMRGTLASYTTAPLSEYIGSHIYATLGIDVHRTELGTRNGKLVVICKDFCKIEGSLREIRTLKNIYNKELNEQLEASLSSTSDSHLINLEDIMIHLHYNPVLRQIPDIQTRFWEQVIVDALINNNDRNNGNWGILYEEGKYKLAPVFDNGAAFYNKLPDSKLSEYLADAAKFQQSADMSRTVFALNGKPLMANDLTLTENADFYETFFEKRTFLCFEDFNVELVSFQSQITSSQLNGFFFGLCFVFFDHLYLLNNYLFFVAALANFISAFFCASIRLMIIC